MSANSNDILQQVRHDFDKLVKYMTGEKAQSRTAYEVEVHLFRQLLALGAQLLRLFFVKRAAIRPAEPVYAADGSRLPYQGQSKISYYSVFGKITFKRHYFYAAGHGGLCPLDAELSLPPRCYSDLLRDWAEYCTTDESYDEANKVLQRILGISISKLALETVVYEDAVDVNTFYKRKAAPPVEEEGTILVVQADGKGVPMVNADSEAKPARLGKGQKRTRKKEAVTTAIYTIFSYQRSPQEVVKALLDDLGGEEAKSTKRPIPAHKEVRATLDGKSVAFDRLRQRVTKRDGVHIQHRVALTDGAEPLQNLVGEKLPNFELVLDIIHASEYLWDSANALLGESHPERTAWVGQHLLQILSGNTSGVIQRLEALSQKEEIPSNQRQALETTIGYFRRNLLRMRYDQYLARGWPIGTGVIEGACSHLVKDRMERSGMQWSKLGAQGILDLRAVRINGDWDDYQRFHRQQQHQRLYDSNSSVTPFTEEIVLDQTP